MSRIDEQARKDSVVELHTRLYEQLIKSHGEAKHIYETSHDTSNVRNAARFLDSITPLLNELSNNKLNRYYKASGDSLEGETTRRKRANRYKGRRQARDRLDARGLGQATKSPTSVLSRYMKSGSDG